MSLPTPSVEFSPPQPEFQHQPKPEPDRPELRLIEGSGEDVAGPDSQRPDLYAVPDEEPAVETAIAEETATEPEEAPRQRAARGASRLLGVVRSGKVLGSGGSETAGSYDDDDHQHRGGGGGWAIREHIRKLAAKAKAEAENHENSCVCQVCRSL